MANKTSIVGRNKRSALRRSIRATDFPQAEIDRCNTADAYCTLRRPKSTKVARKAAAKSAAAKPPLLAGGNPQIAKACGDAPVQAYIAAMPGWKRDVGRRLDALIAATVPAVRKAVKWNSPFYGAEGPREEDGWFLSFHCFTKYIKVAFFRGTSLRPLPPGESKHREVRYLDIHEDDELDEVQVAAWVKQASRLPGERM
jgi:hypothetical protein